MDNNEQQVTAKTITGMVVSNKMDKTVVVTIDRKVKHPLYHKYIKRTTRLLAHDEANECQEGDTVRIIFSRPISKRKSWKVDSIINHAVTTE